MQLLFFRSEDISGQMLKLHSFSLRKLNEMGPLELSAAQYRRLLLTHFVIPDNDPPASMRQRWC